MVDLHLQEVQQKKNYVSLSQCLKFKSSGGQSKTKKAQSKKNMIKFQGERKTCFIENDNEHMCIILEVAFCIRV